MEHMLRQCLIALRLAERSGLDDQARAVVYYTALLIGVGCHSDAHEQAKWFGDDLSLKSGKFERGSGLRGAVSTLALLGSGKSPLHRLRVGLGFLVSGHRELNGMIETHAKLAQTFARQLGLAESVVDAVGSSYEQWNGRGWPGRLQGLNVPVASRLAQLAEYVEVAHRIGGNDAAKALARKQRGKQFDPTLVDLLCEHATEIFTGLDSVPNWSAVIDAEPALTIVLSEEQFDSSLLAIADFIDLKSPFTLGHSRAVTQLVDAAGTALGLPSGEVTTLRRAGLVLGLGRLGVSNSIWDKPGPLGAGERERVRMHPYLTERMLHQSVALAPLGAIAVQFRERLDGSGYPRGLSGGAISLPARILGAADAYHAMREPRPYRAARSADEAAEALRGEVRGKRLDGDAVEAVLGAAGHQTRPRREGPAGLTTREVEVLQLLARGLSNKEIADRLLITAKTAGNHIEHIYSKINATNRASASLFAVQHGLLPELT
ncbi:MAG TPA: HD domain-containing phosphohydrolase [Polyangiaceae bacterium]|nr:HD domain-containing phosphohydrolase [Polyangiaceae bacterium]